MIRKFLLAICAVTSVLIALPLNAEDEDKSKAKASNPIPLVVSIIASESNSQPHKIQFRVEAQNQTDDELKFKVRDGKLPFNFLILNPKGEMVNKEMFKAEPRRRGMKTNDLVFGPHEKKIYDISYDSAKDEKGDNLSLTGAYSVSAIWPVTSYYRSGRVVTLKSVFLVKSEDVQVIAPPNSEKAGLNTQQKNGTPILPANTIPTQADADKLPLAVENPARLPQKIQIGDAAPDFAVLDMNGQMRRFSDYKGKSNTLLTFFPKCFTGGCANHLSSLRDVNQQLEAANVKVLAVSVDPADGEYGQKAFADLWKFQFPLIPDTERKLSLLFGAVDQPTDLDRRMTFLIDKQGIVRWIDTNVQVKSHGADMLAKIEELGLSASK